VNELELSLRELGGEIAWPATPELRLDLEPARRRFAVPALRPLALGLAILLAALAGVLALSPGARSAFLEIFRLKGATVELVETLPNVPTQRVDLGERVDRDEAERRVGFELPGLDGVDPDGVFVLDDRMASLVYGDPEQPRLVLSQLRGALYEGFVRKAGGGGTRVEEVAVGGEPGLFVSGDEHFVMFRDEFGSITDERTFLAGTVLLWNRGDMLFRLEGELTREEAIELAESVE
jgi:hypothetical protein